MKCLSILLLMLSIILASCSESQQGSVALTPAPSSQEALVRALEAMHRRDRDAMLSLVSGGSKAQEFFETVIDSIKIGDAFKQKFIDAYGKNGWDTFQAPLPDGQKGPDMKLTISDFEQILKDSSGWQATAGNRGVFDLDGIPLPFKEVEGGWVIDGNGVFPDEATLVGYTKTQRKFADFVRTYTKAIGHPGISAEDIDYQMGKDFMIAMMGGQFRVNGASPYPDRFKIDEF